MKRPRFLIDTMLGRLAQWLRILGFDAKLLAVSQRKRMLEQSFLEKRVLVTREAKLSNAYAYKLVILREQHWPDQIARLWKELELGAVNQKKIFSRCTACNVPIRRAAKSRLDASKIPARVFEEHKVFFKCPKCRKVFWQGSHIQLTLEKLKKTGIAVL